MKTIEKTTEEKNVLIAEFMGYEKIVFPETSKYLGQYTNPISKRVYAVEDLDFDSDWNWLMLVVEKINKTGKYGRILNDMRNGLINTDIQKTFTACVEFIEWYNLKKQN